jgi:transcriptional regulator with XRE-family HTH domain
LQTLQTGQPFPLQVLASIPVETDAHQIEKQVHAFLAAERRRGEWFEIDLDTPALEQLVVRAVQYVAEQQEVSMMQPLTFGERLTLIRKRRTMTQRQLAERIGCQQSDIYRLESGLVHDPHMSRLVALAHALQVSTDWLSGLRDSTDGADTAPPAPPKATRTPRKAAVVQAQEPAPAPAPSKKRTRTATPGA